MLDSLVRVSRRVGWVTDLLAASLQSATGPSSPSAPNVRPPTPRECGGTASFACDVLSRLPQGSRRWSPEGPRDTSVERRATGGPANNRRRARGAPPATCRRPPSRPSRLRCPTGCGVLRAGDKCVWRRGSDASDGPFRREALPTRRPHLQTESSRHRISRAHPFTSEQFHVLLNSLFKVLCNFPSRYLFAIGLTAVFSLRWSLPPDWGCTPKQPDSQEIASETDLAAMGLAPALGRPRSGGLAAESDPGALTPKRHMTRDGERRGFGAGHFPFRSPLLRESLLVSFPPLIYMLKFGGSSRLI